MDKPEMLLGRVIEAWRALALDAAHRRRLETRLFNATQGQLPMLKGKSKQRQRAAKAVVRPDTGPQQQQRPHQATEDSRSCPASREGESQQRGGSSSSRQAPTVASSNVPDTISAELADKISRAEDLARPGTGVPNLPRISEAAADGAAIVTSSEDSKAPGGATDALLHTPSAEPTCAPEDRVWWETGILDSLTAGLARPARPQTVALDSDDPVALAMAKGQPRTTAAWRGWKTHVETLFSCNDSQALYGSEPGSWVTNYNTRRGPGIPPLPKLPWQSKKAKAAGASWQAGPPATVR